MQEAYCVQEVAQDLGLEPEDLKEIYESYFEETHEMLGQWEVLWETKDTDQLAKLFHGLKGASNNLRMNELGELAKRGEELAKAGIQDSILEIMEQFQQELQRIERLVTEFYQG